MKTLVKGLIFASLALVGVDLLVGCVQKTAGPAQLGTSSPAPGGSTGSVSPKTGMNGTTDSGGGNGVAGKVFESYIVDPLKLPAYTQVLGPILKNIKSSDPTDPSQVEQFFKMKTWYIAPVELDKINKDVLGVSFMKTEPQQIARQTSTEVWIIKSIYDAMDSHAQAELLLHELVMNIYLMKFMPMSDICRFSVMAIGTKGNEACVDSVDSLNKMLPAEKEHPLVDQDYENIRFVTGWLLQNGQKPFSDVSLMRVLISKGFDKRFFNPSNYDPKDQPKDLTVPGEDIYNAVNGASLTSSMPSQCFGVNTGRSQPCQLQVKKTTVAIQGFKFPAFELILRTNGQTSGAPSAQALLFISGDQNLSASDDGNGNAIYFLPFGSYSEKVTIGDRLYYGALFFKKNPYAPQSGLILDSVILKPAVVISTDKTKDPFCIVQAPNPVTLLDEGLTIRQPGAAPNLAERSFSLTSPFAVCTADNVAN